jgi:hypothetical protein
MAEVRRDKFRPYTWDQIPALITQEETAVRLGLSEQELQQVPLTARDAPRAVSMLGRALVYNGLDIEAYAPPQQWPLAALPWLRSHRGDGGSPTYNHAGAAIPAAEGQRGSLPGRERRLHALPWAAPPSQGELKTATLEPGGKRRRIARVCVGSPGTTSACRLRAVR